jgi:hypothetical protein
MTQSDADGLQQFSKVLWNSEVWRVTVNVQHRLEDGYEPSDIDSLRLDFRQLLANPTSKTKHRQTGSLSIDVNTCGLRLERVGEIVAACGDSSEKVLAQFKGLVGKTLIRVDISPPGGDTDFVLEDGLSLRCFPATSHNGETWRVSSAEDDELLLGPGARFSYRSGLR